MNEFYVDGGSLKSIASCNSISNVVVNHVKLELNNFLKWPFYVFQLKNKLINCVDNWNMWNSLPDWRIDGPINRLFVVKQNREEEQKNEQRRRNADFKCLRSHVQIRPSLTNLNYTIFLYMHITITSSLVSLIWR